MHAVDARPGSRVQVTDGRYRGRTGAVQKVIEQRLRGPGVVVELDRLAGMGGERVTVSPYWLAPADLSAPPPPREHPPDGTALLAAMGRMQVTIGGMPTLRDKELGEQAHVLGVYPAGFSWRFRPSPPALSARDFIPWAWVVQFGISGGRLGKLDVVVEWLYPASRPATLALRASAGQARDLVEAAQELYRQDAER